MGAHSGSKKGAVAIRNGPSEIQSAIGRNRLFRTVVVSLRDNEKYDGCVAVHFATHPKMLIYSAG